MCQWFNYNAAGHKRLLFAAGFEIEEATRPFVVRFNVHPKPPVNLRNSVHKVATRYLTGDSAPGVLHQAVLARVRV
jgi:hypothetical protein